ncbi:alanine dehydrogenase [Flavobacterium columnare NBRC 100251 = ATCC 23463]|uniref:Saccharopine dehydrogenase [NAD(+), L-lysine-forming] n=2 Tax=Flavobacterium columnare TaxID=996 RepID=G8X7X6_FLACA|nr:NAD(P)-dependent oxidoreductase [Flavobacterium columnare]AEW87090.1 monofunctional lysine-ketoglutarate reductase [Flavobacterium columnare ATCC 49512]AMO21039.1 alanine dehydrogenase [Flavobacterium columnare]ANO47580.1 monofunctional lysine-ketoglutarate reductase [Flavobacterium columnare]APT21787.1 alanine dehydrogenase [Flavobacterium columnare]AUX19039.1 alanine dehydrogenase [Flavobacterium columnare]
MKFGIIKERKNPPDRRVVFSPQELLKVKEFFPEANFKVETSDIRIFKDEEYSNLGISIDTDLTDCDVLIGVKEVPVEALIPNKTYFFFSHTIKKQPYNRKLLIACLEKNIRLIDHETIVDANNKRLIGFGRYAGIVGAYNGIRAFGLKYDLFNIAKAETLKDQQELIDRLKRITLPPIKVVLSGHGKVGLGAKEMLDGMKMKQVSIEDFLNKSYDRAVYTHIDLEDYNSRKDEKPFDKKDFYAHPEKYQSNFERFTKVADVFMAGHFYGNNAPYILTREMLAAPDNKIKVVADISCDVNGPIACTLRASTIAEPIYGYLPNEHRETHFEDPRAIAVMAVDNLPCELPKDASEGFGRTFLESVIPSFYNNDADQILERATVCQNGKLTPKFEYLQNYVEGKE